jgi:hypothetical protein
MDSNRIISVCMKDVDWVVNYRAHPTKVVNMKESSFRATFDTMIPWRGRKPATEADEARSASENVLRMPRSP